MNWNNSEIMEADQYAANSSGMPYNSIGSFVDFFGGVAYDHVNFIFADHAHFAHQESVYPSVSSNAYKYYGSFSYNYDDYNYHHHHHHVAVNDPATPVHEEYNINYRPLHVDNNININIIPTSTTVTDDVHLVLNQQQQQQRQGNSSDAATPLDCPRHHHSNRNEVVWQDNIDPDSMTYEELLELGEAVGTQSRGLSQHLISLLPVSKYKRCLFSRKKSRDERCVICQMEYKRGEKRMTLPCKHIYHAGCCRRWLGINKACPICYTEVLIDASKH